MLKRSVLLAGVAALALFGCGKKDDAGAPTASSAAAERAGAGSPLDRAFSLEGATAVDADAIFALFPEHSRPTYDSAAFDEKLGATVVTGLAFPPGLGSGAQMTVERAEFYGVDLAAIERVKAAETSIDAPFEKIFEKVRFFGVKADGGEEPSTTTIGGVELDQFRARPGAFAKPEAEESAEGDEPADAKGGLAKFLNAFDLAGVYFKDFDLTTMADAEAGAVAMKAPDLRFVGMGGGKLSAIIANDVEYELTQTEETRRAMAEALGPQGGLLLGSPLGAFLTPSGQRATVESFEWRNIDASGWLAYAIKDEKPPLSATNLLDLGSLKAKNAVTYIEGRKAATVAETTVSEAKFTWLVPSKIRSETKGAVYDFSAYAPPEETETIAVIKRHKLDNVKGSGTFAWDWDAAKGGAKVTTDFETQGLADFDFALALSGLELAKINAAMAAGETDAVGRYGALDSLLITIVDEKMLEAAFDLAGLQSGQTGAEMRASAVAMMAPARAQAGLLSPRFVDYIDAVSAFIGEGGTLEIKAAPEEAVNFQSLMETAPLAPQTVPDTLNLTVTQRKK